MIEQRGEQGGVGHQVFGLLALQPGELRADIVPNAQHHQWAGGGKSRSGAAPVVEFALGHAVADHRQLAKQVAAVPDFVTQREHVPQQQAELGFEHAHRRAGRPGGAGLAHGAMRRNVAAGEAVEVFLQVAAGKQRQCGKSRRCQRQGRVEQAVPAFAVPGRRREGVLQHQLQLAELAAAQLRRREPLGTVHLLQQGEHVCGIAVGNGRPGHGGQIALVGPVQRMLWMGSFVHASAVLFARGEIVAHVGVQLRLVGIPAPGTARSGAKVAHRIETKGPHCAVPVA